MKLYSTNKLSKKVNFKEALMQGQAPDRGLYMPEIIPKINQEELIGFSKKKYNEISYDIMRKFLKDEIPDEVLRKLTKEAYDFEIPIEQVEKNKYIMRLDRGPTASFKDFAARLMARLMNYFLLDENKKIKILVATSGDTGGAVADAYFGQKNISVIVLFPKDEVSIRQRKQMTTLGGNIQAIAIKGKFDDCQRMVKRAFSDPELKKHNLSSANSINFGRLLPQIVYYFYAFSRIQSKDIIFSVPSGNFGDLMGGVLAKEIGLPIKKFIVAVNENDEFVKFLQSKEYQPIEPSRNCLSNAMNVGHPSNLARLFDLYGGQLSEDGIIQKQPNIEKMREDFFAVSINDKETIETIKKAYEQNDLLLEPHGAVGWRGVVEYLKENPDEQSPIISFETADPAKFPKELNKLGIYPKLPKIMIELDNKVEIDKIIINNYEDLKTIIELNSKD